MTIIGVNELSERTADILRRIQDERAEYVVTHEGKPVALLLPAGAELVEKAKLEAGGEALKRSWEAYASIAEKIRSQWPRDRASADVLNSLRR
ncbi:MAG: type II toxin-antitoxin system prevent-host-death family antitoxin [Planctomycetes bacterium]|nr:type II toxin-antitoxin system prevent-host-death family antitoxin [Planctomycetota bacterium]